MKNFYMKKIKEINFITFFKLVLLFIIIIHLLFIIYIGISSLILIKYNPKITSLILYRKIFYNYKIVPFKFIPLSNIPKILQRMVIYIEDGNFYKHHGIDFESLKEAYETNKKFNKIISGASTITMQLARTLFLVPDRNYIRKYFEFIAALEIDLILPKKRILELYLNYVELGKGIFGFETASFFYYKKSVTKLSEYQLAKLVILLASPIKYDVDTAIKNRKLRQRFYQLNQKFQIITE